MLPMLKQRSVLALAALFTLVAPPSPVDAQQQGQPKNELEQMQASGEYKVLTKSIDLPNFPSFASAGLFLWGNVRYRKDGGAEVTLRYAATEGPAAVLNWYKQALTNFHWTLGQSSERMVTARYKNMNTTLITFPSNNPKYACQLNVVFNMPKAVPEQ